MPGVQIIDTKIPEVKIIQPNVFGDERGFFLESWNRRTMLAAGMDLDFVQDNHSRSGAGVLRGIHYQLPSPQGKLVRSVRGAIWDVAVDLRQSSATFLEWVGVQIDDESHNQLWVPPGFGHGFVVLGEIADVAYKTTSYFQADCDRAIRYDDPAIGVTWPAMDFMVSEKDSAAPGVEDAVLYD